MLVVSALLPYQFLDCKNNGRLTKDFPSSPQRLDITAVEVFGMSLRNAAAASTMLGFREQHSSKHYMLQPYCTLMRPVDLPPQISLMKYGKIKNNIQKNSQSRSSPKT